MARKRKQGADPVKQLTVVFDYGGVMSEGFDPIPSIHREVGGDLDAVRDAYWGARKQYDAGALTLDQYWAGVCAAAGIADPSADEALALQDADNHYWGVLARGSRELLHDLARNGVRLVLLSNTSKAFGEYLREQEWFEAFAFALISAEEGVVKPEREIFEIVLDSVAHETGGVSRPGNVIFFDDVRENVEAAQALGIDAHLWPRNGDAASNGEDPYTHAHADGGRNEDEQTSAPGWELARTILTERGLPLD